MCIRYNMILNAEHIFTKVGHACGMNSKGHVLVNLRHWNKKPFEITGKFTIFRVWKCKKRALLTSVYINKFTFEIIVCIAQVCINENSSYLLEKNSYTETSCIIKNRPKLKKQESLKFPIKGKFEYTGTMKSFNFMIQPIHCDTFKQARLADTNIHRVFNSAFLYGEIKCLRRCRRCLALIFF